MARVVLFGAGKTGARSARQLCSSGAIASIEIRDLDQGVAANLADSLGPTATSSAGEDLASDVELVVIATPTGTQAGLARQAVQAGAAVVATSNATDEVRDLLTLDQEAKRHGRPVLVGAGFMPGLTGLIARHASREFDAVEEIHVAKVGTGGPACARQHHSALSSTGVDWRDGRWTRRLGGSGRELVWFPDPVGGRDCYRAALPDALLLVPHFGGVERVTARQAAGRNDRLTAPLPMLRRPHPEGGLGAVRVELRGRVGQRRRVVMYGAAERPAIVAGAVAASVALKALTGGLRPGAYGLAGIDDTVAILDDLSERGIRPVKFEGAGGF